MEKELKAFFYDYKYYLFPEDCQSLAELKRMPRVRVRRLKEDGCMAPYFVYESVTEETLEIEEPNRLFEQTVELYTQREYDEILAKLVRSRCTGCEHFVEDGRPLDLAGHHREMSLDGICYEKEDKDEAWSFSSCVDYFWWEVSERADELAELIDRGDLKKLDKILNEELRQFYYPAIFCGKKIDGNYHLYFSIHGSPRVNSRIIGLMAAMANSAESPLKKKGWTVHPYIPAHTFPYPYDENEWQLGYGPASNGVPYSMTVYILCRGAGQLSEKKAQKIITHVEKCLEYELGEEVFRSVIGGVEVAETIKTPATMAEIIDKFHEKYEFARTILQSRGGGDYLTPFMYGKRAGGEGKDDYLPYRASVCEGLTNLPDVSLIDRTDLEKKPWWLRFASFIYLYVPRASDGPENAMQTLYWYFGNADKVPEPLRNPSDTRISALCVGIGACGHDGFVLDHMVFDEKKFFRTLRTLAPVLRAYHAKMVVVNRDGVMTYSCDYEFTPVD